MNQSLTIQVSLPDYYDVAIDKVTAALDAEGFQVLTSIEVKDTFIKKLDLEFRRYAILGACNSSMANRALQNEPLVGLLLPCNFTVDKVADGVLVSIVNPDAMLGMQPLADNAIVREVASEARVRLECVAAALAAKNSKSRKP